MKTQSNLKNWKKRDRKILLQLFGINALINLNAGLSLNGDNPIKNTLL